MLPSPISTGKTSHRGSFGTVLILSAVYTRINVSCLEYFLRTWRVQGGSVTFSLLTVGLLKKADSSTEFTSRTFLKYAQLNYATQPITSWKKKRRFVAGTTMAAALTTSSSTRS